MTPAETTTLTKTLAIKLGFDLVGVAPTDPGPRALYYRRWLAAGHAGSMTYLHRNVELRENPARLLPGARSAICVALNHYRDEHPPATSDTALTGRVALYARGTDYHRVIHRMLARLVSQLRERLDKPFEHCAFVDTGPLLERELAAAAGLGWIGKNTMLANQHLGSYLFLGEILTTLDLVPDTPASDRCGNCTRCLEACPTKALIQPHQLDASRCISYLTIEHRAEVPQQFHQQIGDWVYGCDICQQVCPFNRHAPPAANPQITAERIPGRLPLVDLLKLRSGQYRRLTKDTAARRASRSMWRRNAAIALGNLRDLGEEERQALAEADADEDPIVRHAARESLRRAQK